MHAFNRESLEEGKDSCAWTILGAYPIAFFLFEKLFY